MSVLTFWASIEEGGRARITSAAEPTPQELQALETHLQGRDATARLELSRTAPSLDLLAAKWAAVQLFRASQFLVFRDLPASVVNESLAKTCPSDLNTASTAYSVDLAFFYLPGVLRQAAAVSEQDPLTEGLKKWAVDWPLSSVGIPKLAEIPEARLDPIFSHPSLRTLYADRVIERKDRSRLKDPRTQEAVREALGAHTNWHPEMSAVFLQEDAIKSTNT